jgi:hypothetical protein
VQVAADDDARALAGAVVEEPAPVTMKTPTVSDKTASTVSSSNADDDDDDDGMDTSADSADTNNTGYTNATAGISYSQDDGDRSMDTALQSSQVR